mmetsp:Transcript_88541/g.280174  ORF Transcript_88541/g.280174 Transcript_88541/m.280174 type:complete len:249 (-) Transcript_88541:63-809(-)
MRRAAPHLVWKETVRASVLSSSADGTRRCGALTVGSPPAPQHPLKPEAPRVVPLRDPLEVHGRLAQPVALALELFDVRAALEKLIHALRGHLQHPVEVLLQLRELVGLVGLLEPLEEPLDLGDQSPVLLRCFPPAWGLLKEEPHCLREQAEGHPPRVLGASEGHGRQAIGVRPGVAGVVLEPGLVVGQGSPLAPSNPWCDDKTLIPQGLPDLPPEDPADVGEVVRPHKLDRVSTFLDLVQVQGDHGHG